MIKLSEILKQMLSEKKADRCKRIADRKYDKPSAYKSGAIVRCRQGDIWKKLKEELNIIKLGVEELFNSNPELASIGTPEQYTQYLDTIFPNSQVKDIVYHGAMEHMLPKNGEFKGYVTYFSDNKKYSEIFGVPVNRKVIQAIINVVNPYNAPSELANVPEEIHITDEFTNPAIIKKNNTGHDSVIGIDAGQKEGKTIAVFDPKQIHILGSKRDIEGFKQFINNKSLNEDESLHKWFKRKGTPGKEGGWVDCNTCRTVKGKKKCKPCGRKEGEKRAKYPACRPTPAGCKRKGKGKTWGKTK